MFLYEKTGSDAKKHIYFTESVPSDTDTQVTYKDATGKAVTDLTSTTDLRDNGEGGMYKASDKNKTAINAFAGEIRLIPQPFEVVDEAVAAQAEPEEAEE